MEQDFGRKDGEENKEETKKRQKERSQTKEFIKIFSSICEKKGRRYSFYLGKLLNKKRLTKGPNFSKTRR